MESTSSRKQEPILLYQVWDHCSVGRKIIHLTHNRLCSFQKYELSPFCLKVRWALQLKGVPYQVENLSVHENIRKITGNAMGKVPVIRHGSPRPKTLSDSSDIILWLEDHHPSPSLYANDTTSKVCGLETSLQLNRARRPIHSWCINPSRRFAIFSRIGQMKVFRFVRCEFGWKLQKIDNLSKRKPLKQNTWLFER